MMMTTIINNRNLGTTVEPISLNLWGRKHDEKIEIVCHVIDIFGGCAKPTTQIHKHLLF